MEHSFMAADKREREKQVVALMISQEQPSIRHKLEQEKAQSKAQHKEKVKVKTKDRGVEL